MPPAYGIGHLKFNRWATLAILTAVEQMQPADRVADRASSYGGIQGTLVHLYRADAIWMDRLIGLATDSLDKFSAPEDSAAFREKWTALLDRYVDWGEALPEQDWSKLISYRNTKGEPLDNTVWQIVLHLVNHGSYHRGQVITMMRQAGAKPASTDLIQYYRTVKAD